METNGNVVIILPRLWSCQESLTNDRTISPLLRCNLVPSSSSLGTTQEWKRWIRASHPHPPIFLSPFGTFEGEDTQEAIYSTPLHRQYHHHTSCTHHTTLQSTPSQHYTGLASTTSDVDDSARSSHSSRVLSSDLAS
ncbi:hypothetical protein E2C01_016441 [Portunus trituberculatus]|uniref:Uncharacterized protein n=1 Tax=Portunus trituberculatus TaxID=210409 RepID=A0A5B7DQJ8_PORTR|nr:hypothetical protein [Portunus trituberculatus]